MAKDEEHSSFEIVIVSPDEVVFEDTATKVLVPGTEQELAILPDHTPLYAQVLKGDIKITLSNGSEKVVPVESGVMRVKLNKVSIILGFDE